MGDVVSERRGDVAWVRLDRPDRMNAYDSAMAHELREAIRDASDAGVIVITGSGKAFCAGGFLKNLANPDPNELRKMFFGSLELFEVIRTSPRPVIAAVNGAAAGGGNELVVACDFAIAARSAKLGQTGPRVGSAPVLGGTNMMAINIGEKRAKEVSMLCRRYTAEQAYEYGWVNEVVDDDQLESRVTEWANELLALSPRYLEIAKMSSNVWWNACRDTYINGLEMLVQAIGSDDMMEGAQAFMEKRAPDFRNKGNA